MGHAKISLPIRLLIEPPEPKKVSDDEGSSIRRVRTRDLYTHSMRWWLLALLECPACFGFWTGLVAGWRFPELLEGVTGPKWLALALFTCASNLLLGKWAGLMEEAKNEAN